MRKALVIFLLALLPFQFVWGAAAGYCQHEQDSEASHFGHHAHKHESQATRAADGSNDAVDQVASQDSDCMTCHLSCAIALPAAKSGLPAPQLSKTALYAEVVFSKLMAPVIYRPNWSASS